MTAAALAADVPHRTAALAPAAPDNGAYLAAQAAVHLKFGHPELAIPLLEKATTQATASHELPRWKISLASAYLQSGEEAKGLAILNALAKSDNLAVHTLACLSLGKYLESRGRPEEALEQYQRVALHADGAFQRAAARRHIARVLRRLPNRADWLKRYEDMIATDPENLHLLHLAAEVRGQMGEGAGRALELLRKLRAARPDDAEVWIEYLRAAEAAGKIDEAVAQYKALRKRLPVYDQFCCENLARLAKGRGRPDEVRRWVAESGKGKPEGPMLSHRLGRLYAALDMPQDAEKHLRAAAETGETAGLRAGASLDLARTLIKLGRLDEAEKVLLPLKDAQWTSIRQQTLELLAACKRKRVSKRAGAVPAASVKGRR